MLGPQHLVSIYCARLLRANAAGKILMNHQTAIEAVQCSTAATLRMSDFAKASQLLDSFRSFWGYFPIGEFSILSSCFVCQNMFGWLACKIFGTWHTKWLVIWAK